MKPNIVITRSMLMGRKWIVSYNANKAALEYVNRKMNFEEIILSMLVWSKANGRDPIYIDITKKEPWDELLHPGRLSNNLLVKKDVGSSRGAP